MYYTRFIYRLIDHNATSNAWLNKSLKPVDGPVIVCNNSEM